MASHLEKEYNIPMIQSRTTRPKRSEDENGHTFVTDEEFDTYRQEWMIAYTKWGDHRYCCLHSDVTDPTMSYVIDESGLDYLRKNFRHLYDIFAVRLYMPKEKRAMLVGEERVMRDEGKFEMSACEFDYFIDTTSFEKNPHKIAKMLIRVYQKFDDC
jgi:guanylate kinase